MSESTQIPNILQSIISASGNNTIKIAGIDFRDNIINQPGSSIARELKGGYSYQTMFKTSMSKALMIQDSFDPENPNKGEKPNTILKRVDVVGQSANMAMVTLNFSPPEVGDLPEDELSESNAEGVKLNAAVTTINTSQIEIAEGITKIKTTVSPTIAEQYRLGNGWDDADAFFQKIETDTVSDSGLYRLAASLQKRRQIFYKDTTLTEEFYEKPAYIAITSNQSGQGVIDCTIVQDTQGIWERRVTTRLKVHQVYLTTP